MLSAGQYSVLTGLALLYVSYVLGSVSRDDAAALPVAIVFAVMGFWQLARGVRSEIRRRSESTDEPG